MLHCGLEIVRLMSFADDKYDMNVSYKVSIFYPSNTDLAVCLVHLERFSYIHLSENFVKSALK
jgi:hypothetical protein